MRILNYGRPAAAPSALLKQGLCVKFSPQRRRVRKGNDLRSIFPTSEIQHTVKHESGKNVYDCRSLRAPRLRGDLFRPTDRHDPLLLHHLADLTIGLRIRNGTADER